MFDYKSPITQICDEMRMYLEGEYLKAVQRVGIHVDKEELAKALSYDRGQYEKGYEDGSAEMEKYKLALFGIIRNSKVMPMWIPQGKSMEEINVMSLLTVKEIMGMSNFDALAQIYGDAEEALARMRGK